MFDKNPYLQIIKHAPCSEGKLERSTLKAFKIDDDDDIAKALGFHAGMVNKVDYFLTNTNDVQLIELTDLKECVQNCHAYIDTEIRQLQAFKGEAPTKREERDRLPT